MVWDSFPAPVCIAVTVATFPMHGTMPGCSDRHNLSGLVCRVIYLTKQLWQMSSLSDQWQCWLPLASPSESWCIVIIIPLLIDPQWTQTLKTVGGAPHSISTLIYSTHKSIFIVTQTLSVYPLPVPSHIVVNSKLDYHNQRTLCEVIGDLAFN